MKLTSLAIIFVIIICPFLFISSQRSEAAIQDQRLRYYYDNAIDNAVQDAAFTLSKSVVNAGYNGNVDIEEGKKTAAIIFFDSIYYAFNAKGNPASTARINACIPVLIFLENQGFSMYALSPCINEDNQSELKHCWYPVQHYVSESLEGRYIIRYTLENKVYIYDSVDNTEHEGDYWEFSDKISYFSDAQAFETLRISAVKNSVQLKLKDYMNVYNQWATGRNLTVELSFPSIKDSDWIRALADEGLIAFAQGFPTLVGKKYEHYALGGGRVIRKPPLIGYSYNGVLYYCSEDCHYYHNTVIPDPSFDPDCIIYFSDTCSAAKEGYFPCPHCSR